MDFLVSFLASVMAGVIANIICKWFDKKQSPAELANSAEDCFLRLVD